MIKCKNDGCPENNIFCCSECEKKNECGSVCPSCNKPNECEDAEFEGTTELEVFQNKTATVIKAIAEIVIQKKHLEEQEKLMKEKLQAAMEQFSIKSFDNELIKVTYMNESVRNSVDSAKLKKKYPDIAAECNKTSNVKAFVKIEAK
ncbi:MAG: hypothetical protein PHR06_01235 [Candidatus Cloacimonetes bacterium]|nr:hypothetical protein [Candidatus Cloacimonadota bacterium]